MSINVANCKKIFLIQKIFYLKMARKTYKKRYYKKSRWSANIAEHQNTTTIPASSQFYINTKLCENPVQSTGTVSQPYTVKNVEFTFTFDSTQMAMYLDRIIGYIIYVPQGMNIDENYAQQHPEYIMAYRFFGNAEYESATNSGKKTPLRVKTRLARRLQTGDSIQLLITGVNSYSQQNSLIYSGVCRWWTKAN